MSAADASSLARDESDRLARELDADLEPLLQREAQARERAHALRRDREARQAEAQTPRTSFATVAFGGVALGVALARFVAASRDGDGPPT